jgi:type IV pilus assembly protein PilC
MPDTLTRRRFARWRQRHTLGTPDLIAFTRQLLVLLQSGLPLLHGLDLIARGRPGPALSGLVRQLRQQIMAGRSLHVALRSHPDIPPLYVQTVAAGESAGALNDVLSRLVDQLETRQALQRRLRSALSYPLVVLCIAVAVMGVMLTWVIPAFESIFQSLGAELPLATRWVLAMSRLWLNQAGSVAVIAITAGGLVLWASRQARMRRWGLELLWKIPLWGSLHRRACLARWTRTLATLCAASLPLVDALQQLIGAAGHPRFDTASREVRRSLVAGKSLSQALARFGPERLNATEPELFSGMMLQMTQIGEESGSLDNMLDRAARQLEQEVEQLVATLSRLIEPSLMVVLGGVVGGLVVALYLPMFQLGQVL